MNNSFKTKKYSSDYGLSRWVTGSVLFIIIIYSFDGGLERFDQIVWIALSLMVMFTLHGDFNTWLLLEGGSVRYKSGGFTVKSASFSKIYEVDRYRRFIVGKHSGSYLVIKYFGEDNQEEKILVREVNFKQKDIKSFISDLREIKPTVKITQQYEDLIAGKYDNDDFESIPADKFGIDKFDNAS